MSIRNNNKAFPNNQFAFSTTSDVPNYYCALCKKYWNSSGRSAAFLAHLVADHGWVDAD